MPCFRNIYRFTFLVIFSRQVTFSEKESFDPELLYVIELLICSSSVRDTIRLACVKSILSFFENLSERSALKKTLFCFLSKTFISCVGTQSFIKKFKI
jgi:hypothetical protein